MTNRPNEEEQIAMTVKNLLPSYRKHLFAGYYPTFKALINASNQIEDALIEGVLKNEDVSRGKRSMAGSSNMKAPEVSIINRPQPY
jgi:hypothetical protein